MSGFDFLNIDWSRLLLNLQNRVMPIEQVAKQLQLDGGTLRRILRGDTEEPKFSAGILLLDFHFEKLPELHTHESLTKRIQ